jgi:hypothetical protein
VKATFTPQKSQKREYQNNEFTKKLKLGNELLQHFSILFKNLFGNDDDSDSEKIEKGDNLLCDDFFIVHRPPCPDFYADNTCLGLHFRNWKLPKDPVSAHRSWNLVRCWWISLLRDLYSSCEVSFFPLNL